MSRASATHRPARDRVRPRRANGLLRGARSPEAIAGLVLVGGIFLLGLLAPWIAPHSPYEQGAGSFQGPSAEHWIGTDEYGRDLLSRVLYGIRQNVLVGAVAVPLGAVAGILLGVLGTVAGWLDTVVQRVFDVSLAFTGLVMGVTVAAVIGPGLPAVLVTVALVNVPLFGRLARNAVRSQLARDYATAARVVGVPPVRLLLRHVLPNSIDPLVVQAALSLSLAVFIEGAMSFIGIGVRLPEPSLGSLLRTSTTFLGQAPLYAVAPMVVITALVLGFNLLGDGLNKGLLKR